jgi:hypothetical protein
MYKHDYCYYKINLTSSGTSVNESPLVAIHDYISLMKLLSRKIRSSSILAAEDRQEGAQRKRGYLLNKRWIM